MATKGWGEASGEFLFNETEFQFFKNEFGDGWW